MSVIRPGKDAHRVLAIGDNRGYGLKLEDGQTVQPQPYTLVGDGAGSVFKIFTSAAALDMGMGINALLDVPPYFAGKDLGDSDTPGLPAQDLVCEERGRLPQPVEHDRRPGAVAQHRLRQAHPAGRGGPDRRHGGAPGPALLRRTRARRATTSPRATRASPTTSSGRTSARSPWAPSRSTRWNCPTSRPRWPPAACGARRAPSTR